MFGINTLKSVYLETFAGGLEPYGFKRLKGTVFFGKLVTDEILVFVTCEKCGSTMPGKKAFRIKAGAQTVYSYDLSEHQLNLTSRDLYLLSYDDPSADPDMPRHYHYDNPTVSDEVKKSLDDTIRVAIPMLSKITDLRSYIDFISTFNTGDLYNADRLYRDSVVLILSDNHDDLSKVRASSEKSLQNAFRGNTADPYYQSALQEINRKIDEELIASRDRVYSDPDLMEKVRAEAASRKEKNLLILGCYGCR